MKCPICKKDVGVEDEFLPFCSERCKIIDLGQWAAESYRVPVEQADEPAAERDPTSKPPGS